MSWSHLATTLVTDAEIGQIEPEAVATGSPWGAVTWANARTEALRDLKIWIEADYADVVGAPDRIRDRMAPSLALASTGGAYTDITTEITDDTEEDVVLSTVFTTFGTDALYIGATYEFSGLFVKMLDSVNAITATLTASYWSGAAWTSLSATDGTATTGKTCAKSGRVTWAMPTAWEMRTLDGSDPYFWVKLTVSAALTSGTAATQLLPLRAPDGLKRVSAYLALHHICMGLSAQAATPDYWRERADSYWQKAVDLYARLRERGGIPMDLNRDDVITAGERNAIASLRMARG